MPEARHELEDVQVERVDAVDRPATRRKWLLLKSEEVDEEMVNAEELARAVQAVLEALSKEGGEGLPLSDDAVTALNTLAKQVGFGATFKARRRKPEEAEGEEEPQEKRGGRKRKPEDEDEDLLKAVVTELRELRAALEKQAVSKSQGGSAPPSRQPQAEEQITKAAPRKLGEGLFANVVFGG